MTFTWCGDRRNDIRIGLQHVVRRIRSSGYEMEYWGTLELTQAGDPHLHLLQRGSYVPKLELSEMARKEGWGYTNIKAIWQGWSAIRYCTKHLAHSHGRRWPGRFIRYSRSFFPGKTMEDVWASPYDGFTWRMEFGRADVVAERMSNDLGVEVPYQDLGRDILYGEVSMCGKIVNPIPRGSKLGYRGEESEEA